MNTPQRSYKIHHFTLIVSPHYLAKLRTTKRIEHACIIDAQLVNDRAVLFDYFSGRLVVDYRFD